MKRPMEDEDLLAMLVHKQWIANLPPADGTTDRLIFDIDAPKEGETGTLEERYHTLRSALGTHRVPLVYRTPNGGIHALYRIPRVSLRPLIRGRDNGIVAEALLGAGQRIADGTLEIFPQATRAIRVPLGKRMAILDPETLRPIPGAMIGDAFDVDMLQGAVDYLEQWHATEIDDLVTHLGHMASSHRRQHRSEGRQCLAHDDISRHMRPRATRHMREIVERGLTGPGSRHELEFRVGAALWAEPALFGLPGNPTSEEVATALAGWILSHHNGYSEDRSTQPVGLASPWPARPRITVSTFGRRQIRIPPATQTAAALAPTMDHQGRSGRNDAVSTPTTATVMKKPATITANDIRALPGLRSALVNRYAMTRPMARDTPRCSAL